MSTDTRPLRVGDEILDRYSERLRVLELTERSFCALNLETGHKTWYRRHKYHGAFRLADDPDFRYAN